MAEGGSIVVAPILLISSGLASAPNYGEGF